MSEDGDCLPLMYTGMRKMQRTYRIRLSLSSCSSIPAISPAIWKENFFLSDCNCKRQVLFYYVTYHRYMFKMHNSGLHTSSKLAPYKIAFREESRWTSYWFCWQSCLHIVLSARSCLWLCFLYIQCPSILLMQVKLC